jgi:secreted Zn-dependent insulinase-like peptidase
MKLCLVTTRHPDTVLELAENMFQQILNKDKSKPECKVGAYTNDIYKGRMIELIPET